MSNKQKIRIGSTLLQDEYHEVHRDLVKVLILNGILFLLLVGLFFWNRSAGIVDRVFEKFLNF
ncbi:MAG: hypothetical protein HY395_02675 [Candidatus Doudnabacteria bacterium]|nr:hypothetical protein [Candidatus Doudnabacteria bacterium]